MKNILVLTYWSFDNALISTYTLPYVQIIGEQLKPGSKIYLVTLSPDNYSKEKLLAFRAQLKAQNIELINYSYRPFGFLMLVKLGYILAHLWTHVLKNKITHIHGWCTPGGAIGYILSKLKSRPLVLDSFEPHAESMVENGTWKKGGFAHRVLLSLEKKQLLRASSVIYTTKGMAEYVRKTYGIDKKQYFVKPACVDLSLFDPYSVKKPAGEDLPEDSIVCIYAGKFGGIYLDREVFDFFAVASQFWGRRFRVLLLTGHTREEIEIYCDNSGFNKDLLMQRYVPHSEVASYMSLATFGICPVKPIPTKRYCTPIKNGEYWAMGLPVVITKNISTDSALIEQENIGYVLQEQSPEEYRKAVEKIDELLGTEGLKEKIRKVAITTRSFTLAETIYAQIYA